MNEENEPEYRFECKIVDENTGEEVITASTYISSIDPSGACESVDMEVGSMLRAFVDKVRTKYEEDNYAEEVEDEDEV